VNRRKDWRSGPGVIRCGSPLHGTKGLVRHFLRAPRRRRGSQVQAVELLVLVAEDDALTQDLLLDALKDAGFQSELSSSGEDTIALLEADASKYRALVTDINLAGARTGWDVAKRARELRPNLPVIYTTGASADQWASHGVPNSVLVQKPFAPAQIVTAIAQLLNQLSTPPATPNA
jgi:CheY-like chemotaxis protein